MFDDAPTAEDTSVDSKRDLLHLIGGDAEGETPDIFSACEKQRCCRYCKHYVVNPWTQRCGLHERNVEATDLCDDFDRAQTEETTDEGSEP